MTAPDRGATSRRSFLVGGAAATVLGVGAAQGLWAPDAVAAPPPADPLGGGPRPGAVPALDGRLDASRGAVAMHSRDFGRLITGTPRAVLRPGSVRDVSEMIRHARDQRLTLAMNGQSGRDADLESHSNYGQALVPGGISVDARSIARITRITATSATVEPGVTWAQLVNAALARGLTPPALTDYLHLSVGGTISVGGIGGTVQRVGWQTDTVEAVTVVTGTGEVVEASARRDRPLFVAALAGAGQAGVIVSVTLALVPAPQRVAVTNLFYDDLATYMADQQQIMSDGRFSHQSGEIVPRAEGDGWRYKIEVASYYSGAAPDRARLLADLRDERAARQTDDLTYRDWVFRLDPFEDFLKSAGNWAQPKPWLSLVLPARRTRTYIESIVAELTREDLGAGFAGLYPFPRARVRTPLLITPNEPTLWLFDLLRFPNPGQDTAAMLEQNRRFYDRAVPLGAKRYLVGAIPRMTTSDWQRHYGAQWGRVVANKRRFDPDGVLTPGWGFFGPRP